MLKINYEYSGKKFTIAPYTTAQEKDLLLLSTVGESDLDIALGICGIDGTELMMLTQDEKVAMLYKIREISVGAEVNLKFKCKHCNSDNENSINIEDIVQSSKISNNKIKDQFKELTDDNINQYLLLDIDELDIDEYEAIEQEVKDSVTKFNFRKPATCQKCSKVSFIRISAPSFVLDIMSEDSLISLYQTYNDLIFFGKYTKLDIDSLYPFERTIFVSLLNKSREDINHGG
jgi:hypothetical protein